MTRRIFGHYRFQSCVIQRVRQSFRALEDCEKYGLHQSDGNPARVEQYECVMSIFPTIGRSYWWRHSVKTKKVTSRPKKSRGLKPIFRKLNHGLLSAITRRKTMTDKKKNNSTSTVGEKILVRLKDFTEALETSDTIPKRFTCRTVKLNLEPTPFNPERIKKARKTLSASQTIFAQFLGVSVGAVRDWEQGAKSPRGVACRLIDEILRDPKYWRTRLADLATPAGSS